MDIGLDRLDPSVPDPVESRRRAAGRFVRIVYGTFIFGLLSAVILYFGAPLVFLGGPGTVSAPRHEVSLPYVVQVVQTRVRPGGKVEAGDEIAQVRSPQHDEIIASYMRGLADLAGREAELRIRARVARDSLAAARSYLQLTDEAVKRLEAAPEATNVSTLYQLEVLSARAQALKTVVTQEAEAAEAAIQIESLSEVRERFQEHLDRTDAEFAGGRVVAPISGIVARNVPRIGQSLAPESAIAEIFDTTDLYVDWYIPNYRLIDPKVGNNVFVLFGNRRIPGVVDEILPLSGMPEAGAPHDQSGQIARIRFAPDVVNPALNATVRIHMHYSTIVARAAAALVDFLGLR
ncbi:HlyD family efflux transporter periplasmic adaptor subunit [Sinorhizobium medicae]|uniref:HlyD family efflux transporter periplasmic adaptor subunit n=1 Tax=Sinorhizobium medicae TaxID=110321 RepID=UPI00041B3C7F|nr:HlyD family efflux transporter periplasmic adaptor subunit [Sinorhizobium medicae]MBO1944704.1 HlyD family efflux transporter periplasmic adaptor subunit [Sinorhizobium medicae]MDX0426775.1 HlyD family efflux transporter periplasmic adaptor subunit [Sinorhizobium medicae]MDX0445494.1 HlyD family efflux transporter periplasmic adaptor subunit [Sinorhizobium medicae]MDX0487735.1 HlyD family efflux transporter periplasmic adaptor subunit [Sinorhizobium medicae]MDX0499517.1 HlyD family efflux t